MRTVVAVALAALAALGAVALGRLGEALGQLRALDTLTATRVAGAARAPTERTEPAADESPAAADERVLAAADERALAANGGDEHIRQWLAADPEFRRAAEELLHDPDLEVRQEARRLLRELGALDEP